MSSVNFPVLCATIGPATKTIWRNTLKTSIAVPKAAIMHPQALCNNNLRQGSLWCSLNSLKDTQSLDLVALTPGPPQPQVQILQAPQHAPALC